MTDNWEDFRTEQGGGKGISFGQVGDRSQIGVIKGGRIVDVKPKQEIRDFNDKSKIRTTSSGRTLWQLPVMLQTQERVQPDDDGQRVLYVKGLMFDAIDEALKAAGRETLEIGGVLEIAYIGDRTVGKGQMRVFKARYTPAPPQAQQNQGGVWGQQPAAADPFAGGQPAQQPHPSEAFAAAGGPSVQPWPNNAAAGPVPGPPAQQWAQQQAAPQGPPAADPAWGQPPQQPQGANPNAWGQPPAAGPGPQGYANGGQVPPGNTPAADPWGQQANQPTQPEPTLGQQWAAAGQPQPDANPWA